MDVGHGYKNKKRPDEKPRSKPRKPKKKTRKQKKNRKPKQKQETQGDLLDQSACGAGLFFCFFVLLFVLVFLFFLFFVLPFSLFPEMAADWWRPIGMQQINHYFLEN